MCRPEITPVLQLSSSRIFGSLVRPSVQSAATSNRCPIGGVRRPIGGVPISMMLRGCTKFPAVETTHIHDILRVRGIKNYFNKFLSNCLAFSRSKFVHLPQLSAALPHQSLRRIRNPSFGIQASNFSHIKRRPPSESGGAG